MKKLKKITTLGFLLIIFAYLQNALSAVSLKVFMKDNVLGNTTQVNPWLYVKNTGTDTLKNFYFYYYFTVENGNTPTFTQYNAFHTTSSLEKLDGNDYRLKFLVSGWPLVPNDSLWNVQFGIYYDYIKPFDKTNDYSYIATTAFVEDTKIPVFLISNDSLIYGSPPVAKPVPILSGTPTSGTDSLKVQFTDSSTGIVTSRLWVFGDNTTDTSKNPLHNYTKADTFSVKLVVIGPGGKDSTTQLNYIKIAASIPKPKADFSFTPTSGLDSLTVQFTDLSTGAVTSRLWTFGDDSTGISKNPLHKYLSLGSFFVKLVVIGPGGKDSLISPVPIVIISSIPKPIANFSFTPTSGMDSLKVQFTDSSTGFITSRLWTFGDNATDTSKNPLHNYSTIGNFPVKLVVVGPGGKDSLTSPVPIVIKQTIPKPKAYFSGSPTTGEDSLLVQFLDSSTGSITSHLWNFGDNTTDTAKNPLHRYRKAGMYSVTLAVVGPGGTDSYPRINYIAVTSSTDTVPVVNTIQITKVIFDSSTNAIKVFWTKDSAQSKNYWVGIYYSASEYPLDTGAAKQIVSGTRSSDSVTISLGRSILFDTTYYVALRLKKGFGPWSFSVTNFVRVSSFSWQEIAYFKPDTVRDTAFGFNKRVRISTEVSGDPVKDTLIAWSPVGAGKNGLIPVSIGFYFKQKVQSPNFYVGLACDSIPMGYSIANVRIYRYANDCWSVEQGSAFDAAGNFVYVKTHDPTKPFIAMIDTMAPLVSLSGFGIGPVISGEVITDTFFIRDNICNAQCSFHYTKGANSYLEGDSVDTVLTSKSDTLVLTIPGTMVTGDAGVRAIFIVSDGVNTVPINVSRQVIRRVQSDIITTEAMQWMPLHITAMPDSPSAKNALHNFSVNGEWKYDPTAFRMFRWYACSLNVGKTDKWVEYSDAQKDLFSFVPGTILWLKSFRQGVIDFGRATTPSLASPIAIILQPNGWTDIAPPYKFDILIGDVLNATIATGQSADSLQLYQWALDTNKHYYPKPVYIPGLASIVPDLGNKRYSIISKETIGYSVFNPFSYPVRLSVPPVPASMSSISSKTAKKRAPSTWAIKVAGRTQEGASLCPVYCGYESGKEKSPVFFKAPPQFDNIALRVCDARENFFGHEVVSGVLDEGGISFDLAVINSSASGRVVECDFEIVGTLPEGMQALLIDPQTGASGPIEKTFVVGVNGGERVHRQLAVGGKEYLAKIKLATQPLRLDLLGAYPNPFVRQVRIRYSLPATGIGRVRLSVLGISGKTVFETIRSSHDRSGVCEFLWDGTDRRKKPVGAGVYVLRMTAFDEKEKTAGTFERKITYMP